MPIQIALLLLCSLLIGITANFIRFKVSDNMNRGIIIIASLVVIELYGLLFGFEYVGWFLLAFIGISAFCFPLYGTLFSSLTAGVLVAIQTEAHAIFMLFFYLLFGMIAGSIAFYNNRNKHKNENLLSVLISNSKQLNVFREVSISLQQTYQLEKLLQIVLTSVTAGHGLGFNRAMIFLLSEEGLGLKGTMGTGPMTADEGYETWDMISKNKYELSDLIDMKDRGKNTDPELNELLKTVTINLDDRNILYRALETGEPHRISGNMTEDKAQRLLAEHFNMKEGVIFPLINQGKKIGMLIIDNIVTKRPITAADIDGVIPLANQAASAIQQAQLYARVEEMALRDGLTGLLNQRAFQTTLEEHFKARQDGGELSLILLDIDYFKHYNDTNGHLMGNQVLRKLSNVIQESIREYDFAFRFGGEEFVVLLPDTTLEGAAEIAERLRANIEAAAFPYGEQQPDGRLTVSLGTASTRDVTIQSDEGLVDAADKALYKAKASGRNQVVIHERCIS